MSAFVLAGVGGALLAAGVMIAWWPRLMRPRLVEMLQEPPPPPDTPDTPPPSQGGWSRRLGAAGVPLLATVGLPTQATRRRLVICDRDSASYLAQKASLAALGMTAPPLLGLALLAVGASLPGWLAALVWMVCAVVLWLAPDLELGEQARHHTREMEHTLAAVCDLVVIALAGGAGVTQALEDAARSSHTWAMRRIRTALRTAAIGHQPAWHALQELGERYQVATATELAASLRLAGADGAKVRTSLSAKAASLRTQHLAQLEAEAHSATERMSLPVVLLFAGFLVLIGFPALHLVLTGL